MRRPEPDQQTSEFLNAFACSPQSKLVGEGAACWERRLPRGENHDREAMYCMMRRQEAPTTDPQQCIVQGFRDRRYSATVPIVVPPSRIRGKDPTPLIKLIQWAARIDAQSVTSEDCIVRRSRRGRGSLGVASSFRMRHGLRRHFQATACLCALLMAA